MKRYVLVAGQPWGLQVWTALNDDRLALATDLRDVADWSRYRYVFLCNWSKRIPDDVLAQVEMVNFHCTALPFGRGGGPIENLLLRGHTQTIITAHRVVHDLDAGPVYAVSPGVSLAGTKAQILERFVEPVTAMIRAILDTEPVPVPQQGEVVTFRRLPPEEYQRFWEARARG